MLHELLLKIPRIPILDSKLINLDNFGELIIRFGIDFLIAFILIRVIYYPIHKRKDYLFTYFLFNILIFFICILLSSVKLKLGFAFGLFAIFGILRYRTEQLPIKEMTYLFMIIAIAIINSLTNKKISFAELMFTNIAIVTATYLLEKVWLIKHESRKTITYERIELIKPENHEKLIKDVKDRTGLNIHRVQIGKVDFLRDTAQLVVFYHEEPQSSSFNDDSEKISVTNKNE